MAAPPHHFMQNVNNTPQNMRNSQFGPGALQNQMASTMQNQLPMQNANLINNQMMPQMVGSNQVLGGYNMNQTNQLVQHQATPNPLQQIHPSSMEFSSNNLQHHTTMQQNQQQQSVLQQQQSAPTPPAQQIQPQQPQQQQQSKEINTASLCRIGQETVQDIVSRTQEVFQTLKAIQPPNGASQSTNVTNEKKAKVQEQLRTIRVLFKRLHLIYAKCNDNCQFQGMEYTHIESLIPYKDEVDPKHEEKKNSEAYRLELAESKEVMEQVVLKNKLLKEVIDHLRRIIWEINTMLTMRKS